MEISRYGFASTINYRSPGTSRTRRVWRPRTMSVKNITYRQLKAIMLERAGREPRLGRHGERRRLRRRPAQRACARVRR
jgi:hypothetical protein